MSHPINPPTHVGECATCGRMQELEICEGCETQEKARTTPYYDLWVALEFDKTLQRSFDVVIECFDSGHEIWFTGGKYSVFRRGKLIGSPMILSDLVQWCIQNREKLI